MRKLSPSDRRALRREGAPSSDLRSLCGWLFEDMRTNTSAASSAAALERMRTAKAKHAEIALARRQGKLLALPQVEVSLHSIMNGLQGSGSSILMGLSSIETRNRVIDDFNSTFDWAGRLSDQVIKLAVKRIEQAEDEPAIAEEPGKEEA